MCLLLLLLQLYCYSLYLETRVGCGRLRLTSSSCQTINPLLSVRCKDFGNICCASRDIAHFVLKFVAMATRVGRGKIQLAAFHGLLPKPPSQMQKKSHRYLLHKPSYSQFCPKFRCHGNGGRWAKMRFAIGSIQWPIPEKPL